MYGISTGVSGQDGQVLGAFDSIGSFFSSIQPQIRFTTILDIIIVALLFYWVYLLLRQTRAVRILYGIAVLLGIWAIGQWLNLSTLNYILKLLTAAVVVAIPVVFQPELRAGLERLGRAPLVTDFTKLRKSQLAEVTKKISDAVEVLAHSKIGAIIVIARSTGLREVAETGVRLNADTTSELIISIFSPESALHDGAIIVAGNKITAAKVILPLSDSKFDYRLGTRHRAAVGITSQSDALAIVVSGQRGEISLAVDGLLETKIPPADLDRIILNHLQPSTKNKKQ